MVSRLVIAWASIAAVSSAGALEAAAGRAMFERSWVLAPSSLTGQAGLGPLYDARACASCHRGAGPGVVAQGPLVGGVVRLGDVRGMPDPVYGAQLQTRAAPGLRPEAAVDVRWRQDAGWRVGELSLSELGYGPLATATHVSLRRAPGLAGVGLLDQVTDSEILSRADPADHDGDGVSGRPAWLVDGKGARRLGRWGWKAAQPMLEAQTAAALERDLGVSASSMTGPWGDCTPSQSACRRTAGKASAPEGSETVRLLIVAYLRSLVAPVQAPLSEGRAAFTAAGCGVCHASLHTAAGAPVPAYSDLLLHDMGTGLADGVGEGAATPSEWRTAPLWNLKAELEAGGLLHDGRARSVAEAVAWHGGEGARARARYRALSPQDRQALGRFLLGQ